MCRHSRTTNVIIVQGLHPCHPLLSVDTRERRRTPLALRVNSLSTKKLRHLTKRTVDKLGMALSRAAVVRPRILRPIGHSSSHAPTERDCVQTPAASSWSDTPGSTQLLTAREAGRLPSVVMWKLGCRIRRVMRSRTIATNGACFRLPSLLGLCALRIGATAQEEACRDAKKKN